MTTMSITQPQVKQYKRFVEDAGDKALAEFNLDKDQLQRLFANGGEFQADIAASIRRLSVSNQFADEEVKSNYRYPGEYKGPRPIDYQVQTLASIFGLDLAQALAYVKKLPELPDGAEGWFAVLSPAAASKLFPEIKDEAERQCRMLQLVHEKIAASRKFYNYREDQIDTAHLKVHPRTAQMMSQLAAEQSGDILIIAAQLGMRHRGRSSRRAREVFVQNEFGLTSVSVGSIILVHPERLVRSEELDMDCAGEDFSDGGDGHFDRAPCFHFDVDKVWFDTRHVSHAHDSFGTASALVPQ